MNDNKILNQQNYLEEFRSNLLINLNIIVKRDHRWRQKRYQKLNDIINKKIHKLQNPLDCNSAKKLVCDLYFLNCGFGCRLHQLTKCLAIALTLNRTLIYEPNKLIPQNLLINKFFKSLSNTCHHSKGNNRTKWLNIKKNRDDYQVIDFPIYQPNRRLTPIVPKELSDELQLLSDDPMLTYISCLVKYIMRPKNSLKQLILKYENQINYNNPVVGIHVRRTDKLAEALYHTLDEYMVYVEDFYRSYGNTTVQRVVYLATDEPRVWNNEIEPYIKMGYIFIGNKTIAKKAKSRKTRQEFDSTRDLLIEINTLSKCDYIVCTLSSNVCRLVIELFGDKQMGTISEQYKTYQSLDTYYYFAPFKLVEKLIVIINNNAIYYQQLDANVGDILSFDITSDYHLNSGYINATNMRTNKSGYFPIFKCEKFIEYNNFSLNY
ncbi:alpha-(1,6)-fucosyltransferase-like [Oppia nitens]|uniref:alpha-(1,6)-fucosyltransferase-like n=1 Tax=Oppia nitens TaxID=1686743 RepID=UPI0023DA9B9C|nr:alpha-(1,6)-fucosyltransferase-like [Oppia nitens]